MRINYNKFSFISRIILLLAIINSTHAQNCKPDNCPSTCTPKCSSTEVCTLGLMTTCGVCPVPKCSSKNVLGFKETPTKQNSNSGLIGGVVGGLLGGGLLLGGIGYLFVRRRNKNKQGLPVALRQKLKKDTPSSQNSGFDNRYNNNNRSTVQSTVSVDGNNRQVISGIIPVTFIPPSISSNSQHNSYYSEADTPGYHTGSFATFANHNSNTNMVDENDNPFNDRPLSIATSIMTTTTNNDRYSRRDSIESVVSSQQTATIVQRSISPVQRNATIGQATQISRAKPQIMRVNTITVNDGISRSGSVKKTIRPETSAIPENVAQETISEDPFDDKHVVRQSTLTTSSTAGSRNNKVTDSVVSSADGEITIFFDGN